MRAVKDKERTVQGTVYKNLNYIQLAVDGDYWRLGEHNTDWWPLSLKV
jgi:hypothetical protein